MFRVYNLPLPTTPTSLWQLLINNFYIDSLGNVLFVGGKTGKILPDRVAELDVRPADANTGDVILSVNSGANVVLTNMSMRSSRNSICLKDYSFYDSPDITPADRIILEIEAV